MNVPDELRKCKTGPRLVRLARRRQAEIVTGGRHTKVRYAGATIPIPMHGNRQLPTGTLRAIWKAFIRVGLVAIVLGVGLLVSGAIG